MLSSFKTNYFDKWRVASIGLLLLGLVISLGADWYWSNICAQNGCTSFFRMAYLAPLREAGMLIAIVALPFIFIPTHYFKVWFVWIFVPFSVLTILGVSEIDPNSSNMFADSRAESISNQLLPWSVVTLLFIAWRHLVINRYQYRVLYIALMIALAIGVIIYNNPYLSNFSSEIF